MALTVRWFDMGSLWKGPLPSDDLLTCLDQNPFAPLQEMEQNDSGDWEPYDHSRALQTLQRGVKTSIELRTLAPAYLRAWISRHTILNSIGMVAVEEHVRTQPPAVIAAYFLRIAQANPTGQSGQAGMDRNLMDFYEAHHLSPLPLGYGESGLDWLHIFHPRGYERFFARETLLNAPAFAVAEDATGIISMQVYENPLDFATPETHERIITLNTYLDQRRLD